MISYTHDNRKLNKALLKLMYTITLVFVMHLSLFSLNVHAQEMDESERTAIVFIGDSRTVGMNKVVHMDQLEDTYVIAKVGMGYNWLIDSAIPQLEDLQSKHSYKRYLLVFNLGVNDLKNIDKYIEVIPKLQNYGELYYVSINPTVDEVGGIQCSAIEKFNNALKAEESKFRYIDCYSYLKKVGYKANDGMHYDNDVYRNIYNYEMLMVCTWEYLSENAAEQPTRYDVENTF